MKKKYFTFAALALALTACNKTDEIVPVDNLKDMPITVTAGVAELTTRAGYGTTETASVLPETFYLSIDQANASYDYTNVTMKHVEGAWKAYEADGETEKTLLWGSSTSNVTVTAATFPLTGAQELSVQADQSTEAAVLASDHLYMAATTQGYAAVEETETTPGKAAGAVNVAFDHIMSKVLLTITLGDEFNEASNPISNVTFMGTVASNSYTAGTGWAEIAEGTEATDIVPLCNAYTALTTEKPNATAEYEVILVPQTVDANTFTVVFHVGDRIFKWTSTSAVTLASGYKYTLELTAGKDLVSSASFTATAWNTTDGEGNENKLSGETE